MGTRIQSAQHSTCDIYCSLVTKATQKGEVNIDLRAVIIISSTHVITEWEVDMVYAAQLQNQRK